MIRSILSGNCSGQATHSGSNQPGLSPNISQQVSGVAGAHSDSVKAGLASEPQQLRPAPLRFREHALGACPASLGACSSPLGEWLKGEAVLNRSPGNPVGIDPRRLAAGLTSGRREEHSPQEKLTSLRAAYRPCSPPPQPQLRAPQQPLLYMKTGSCKLLQLSRGQCNAQAAHTSQKCRSKCPCSWWIKSPAPSLLRQVDSPKLRNLH